MSPINRTVKVDGMHCPACVQRLTSALSKVPGVTSAHVTLSPPQAHLETSAPVPLEALSQAARSAGNYTVSEDTSPAPQAPQPGNPHTGHTPAEPEEKKPSVYPLILIVAYIAGTVGLATWLRGPWSWFTFMNDFMAGFFLVFSFFKLLDLRGFADAYQSYDILAARLRPWALVYPFIELALGIAYLARWEPTITNGVTLVLMLIGAVGVFRALARKTKIRCACLGTALNLPMTTLTLTEDLVMAAMAGGMLMMRH